MKRIKVQEALMSIAFVAGLIGIGFLGLALGNWLKAGAQSAMSQHPLFHSGIELLTSSVVCGLLLFGSRSGRKRAPGGEGDPQ